MADVNTSDLRYAVRLQIGAVLVALIAAGAFISVPVPGSPVPIVLQNMFVVLTGVVLAPSWAALTVVVYLVIGAVGLPVFAGAAGGIAHFAGPTGGFLLGFPFSAALTSWIIRGRDGGRVVADVGVTRQVLAMVAGFVVVYVLGVPWLALTAQLALPQALLAGMVPFLPGDLLKAAVLLVLTRTVPRSLWRTLS